jgi:hypothetical protein
MDQDSEREYYGTLARPDAKRLLNRMSNADPKGLYADLLRNMTTTPDPESADDTDGTADLAPENSRFYKIREILPQAIDSDPILKLLDQIKESGFNLNAGSYSSQDIQVYLEVAALVKLFDPTKYKECIKMRPEVWAKLVKPELDKLVKKDDILPAITVLYNAKILFPKESANFVMPEGRGKEIFSSQINQYLFNRNWDKFLPVIEKLKFLGWEKLPGNLTLTTDQWNNLVNWLYKSSAQGVYFAERVYLANLVRPVGVDEIKLSVDQWQKCITTITEKKANTVEFLRMAKKLKNVQVAE